MALTVVQAKKIENGSGHTVTVNAAMTVTGGNLLVAGITQYNSNNAAAGATASDQNNGTYALIDEAAHTALDGSTGGDRASLHYAKNITGGSLNLTATSPTATFQGLTASFHEISGADTAAPLDTHTTGASTSSTTNPQVGSITNTNASSVFFAVLCNVDGSNPSTYTVNSTGSSPTGWALKDTTNSQEVDAFDFVDLSMPFLIVSSSAATTHGWTTSNFSWSACIAAFQAASAGGGGLPFFMQEDLMVGQMAAKSGGFQ